MATGLVSFATTYALGDVKPVVYTGVTSSTGGTLVSGTWIMLARTSGGDTPVTSGIMQISGSSMNTGLHTWSTLGVFVVRASITFSDGIVDNTISSVVSVVALQA